MSWSDQCARCKEHRADCDCPEGFAIALPKEEKESEFTMEEKLDIVRRCVANNKIGEMEKLEYDEVADTVLIKVGKGFSGNADEVFRLGNFITTLFDDYPYIGVWGTDKDNFEIKLHK